jgi:hypothetical protein
VQAQGRDDRALALGYYILPLRAVDFFVAHKNKLFLLFMANLLDKNIKNIKFLMGQP